MDSIVLAEKIFRIIRTRQTQITEIIVSNQVKDWNDYQNHLGQLDTLNRVMKDGELLPNKENKKLKRK